MFAPAPSRVAPRYTGFAERSHLRKNFDRGTHQAHAETGAGAFSQSKIEIEQRLQSEMIQNRFMTSFDRLMRGNKIVFTTWLQTHCNQCGRSGNEPVQYDWNTCRRCAKHQSAQPRDF